MIFWCAFCFWPLEVATLDTVGLQIKLTSIVQAFKHRALTCCLKLLFLICMAAEIFFPRPNKTNNWRRSGFMQGVQKMLNQAIYLEIACFWRDAILDASSQYSDAQWKLHWRWTYKRKCAHALTQTAPMYVRVRSITVQFIKRQIIGKKKLPHPLPSISLSLSFRLVSK